MFGKGGEFCGHGSVKALLDRERERVERGGSTHALKWEGSSYALARPLEMISNTLARNSISIYIIFGHELERKL